MLVFMVETLLEELKLEHKKPVQLFVDNKSAISLSKNPVFHDKSKYIEIKFYFFKDQVSKEKLKLIYYNTEDQVIGVFTKSLKYLRIEKLRDFLELKPINVLIKEKCCNNKNIV